MHQLEEKWGVDNALIMDAVCGANDLVQRGLRGIVADYQFKNLVLSQLAAPWKEVPARSSAVDYAVTNGDTIIRIQVKMQTLRDGKPDCDKTGRPRVETQKTRMRSLSGRPTRLYLDTDFDILAVSLWPSTRKWDDFVYAAMHHLTPAKRKPRYIAAWQTMTGVPIWLKDLPLMLSRVEGKQAIRESAGELELDFGPDSQ